MSTLPRELHRWDLNSHLYFAKIQFKVFVVFYSEFSITGFYMEKKQTGNHDCKLPPTLYGALKETVRY